MFGISWSYLLLGLQTKHIKSDLSRTTGVAAAARRITVKIVKYTQRIVILTSGYTPGLKHQREAKFKIWEDLDHMAGLSAAAWRLKVKVIKCVIANSNSNIRLHTWLKTPTQGQNQVISRHFWSSSGLSHYTGRNYDEDQAFNGAIRPEFLFKTPTEVNI